MFGWIKSWFKPREDMFPQPPVQDNSRPKPTSPPPPVKVEPVQKSVVHVRIPPVAKRQVPPDRIEGVPTPPVNNGYAQDLVINTMLLAAMADDTPAPEAKHPEPAADPAPPQAEVSSARDFDSWTPSSSSPSYDDNSSSYDSGSSSYDSGSSSYGD